MWGCTLEADGASHRSHARAGRSPRRRTCRTAVPSADDRGLHLGWRCRRPIHRRPHGGTCGEHRATRRARRCLALVFAGPRGFVSTAVARSRGGHRGRRDANGADHRLGLRVRGDARVVVAIGDLVRCFDFSVEHDGRPEDTAGAGPPGHVIESDHARHAGGPGPRRRAADDYPAGIEQSGRRRDTRRARHRASPVAARGHCGGGDAHCAATDGGGGAVEFTASCSSSRRPPLRSAWGTRRGRLVCRSR